MNRGDKRDGRNTPARFTSSSAYTRTTTYAQGPDSESSAAARRKLEAMFSGGGAPDGNASLARRHGAATPAFASPRKMGRTPSEHHIRLERLRSCTDPEQLIKAIDDFLQYHQLPDKLDVLLKILQHPAEKVLREAMGQIASLLSQGRISNTVLLLDRLTEIAGRIVEPATQSYVQGLRDQIDRSFVKRPLVPPPHAGV